MSIQEKVNEVFRKYFGQQTPLRERLTDIQNEFFELIRWRDMNNLKEETGDLLASLLQLCAECGWDYTELINNTLTKIESRRQQYLSMGRKKRVAIYGGSFDPIHNGHIGLARHLLTTSNMFDEVWLMPCFTHRYSKQLSPADDRLAMCRMAAAVDGRIRVSDFEVTHQLDGSTYSLVKCLLEQDFAKDEYDFSFAIGQDVANECVSNWFKWEDVERMIRFVVVPRKGVPPLENAWYLQKPHIYLNHEVDILEISSSKLRDAIKHGHLKYERMTLTPHETYSCQLR